ncbi:MAG TPA: hypothetical protein VI278_08575, partial [Nitrososphaeraceae archaeon]
MLSDLILEHNGKAVGNRVLDAGIQKRETTVTARGKVRGLLDVSIIITYWNMPRSVDDKGAATTSTYYYGEGNGVISIIGDSNETTTAAIVTEYGVGKSLGQKVVWRGSAFYRTTTTASTSLSFLNNLVG